MTCDPCVGLCGVEPAAATAGRVPTCVVLGQVLVLVLLLLLAKPSAAGLLLLFGLLHGDASHSPSGPGERGKELMSSFVLTKEENH